MSEPAPKPANLGDEILGRVVVRRFDFQEIVIVPVLSVVIALLLGALTMLATGVGIETIGRSFAALFTGSFGSVQAVSETLLSATPLILCGLGRALGFRAGRLNIGAVFQPIELLNEALATSEADDTDRERDGRQR